MSSTDGKTAVAGDKLSLLVDGVEVGHAMLDAAAIASGYVDVTASTLSEGQHPFTARLAMLISQYPTARVLFESFPTREFVKLLVSEEADLAISSAPLDHPSREGEEIGHWQLLCALPTHQALVAQKKPKLAKALAGRFVAYSAEAPQSAVIDHWLESHNVTRNVAAEVRSGLAACAVAATGVAVAFVDDLSARAHKADGLVFASIEDAPSFPVYLVKNRHRPLPRFGEAFSEIVRAQLKQLQSTAVPKAGFSLLK